MVLFRVEGNHRLPPTSLSPGDMVCVRTCDSRGAGATSSMQGFINNLGEDGCSITVALESRHGDPTFSRLFGKTVRIDRIYGLADALTYEVCEDVGADKFYISPCFMIYSSFSRRENFPGQYYFLSLSFMLFRFDVFFLGIAYSYKSSCNQGFLLFKSHVNFFQVEIELGTDGRLHS